MARDLLRSLALRRAAQRARRRGDRGMLVGGPLTVTPALRERAPGALVVRALDGVLRGWWALVRWLVV